MDTEEKMFLSRINGTQNHHQWKNRFGLCGFIILLCVIQNGMFLSIIRSPGENTADLLTLYYGTLSITVRTFLHLWTYFNFMQELLQLQHIYHPDFR